MGLPLHAPHSPALAALHATLPTELRHTLRRADQLQGQRRDHLTTGRRELDQLLGGGLPYGALTEVRGHVGSGRFATVLASLAAATSGGEHAALVDLGDGLDPKVASAGGVDLERVLWIRPRHLREAVAAAEIAITGGFPLVAVDLGLPPVRRGGRVDASVWIRLARTAARERCAVVIATTWPLDSPAAELVLTYSRRRGEWLGRAMPLLAGVVGELRIERGRNKASSAPARLAWRLPEAWGEGPNTLAPVPNASSPAPNPPSLVPLPSSLPRLPTPQSPIPNTPPP